MTEVIADEVYFADSKQESSNYSNQSNNYQNAYSSGSSTKESGSDFSDGFFEAPDDDTALPFDL